VIPKQSLIVAIDSMGGAGSVVATRTVFRWLYYETKYNCPADNDEMFSVHRPDMGWGFRIANKVSSQLDTFNCAVCLSWVTLFAFCLE
jgi:hypothetical protein